MTTIISRIARLQHPGVLRDFRWPSDLPEFAKFNLIYGWNGTGKTTLSRFLRHLEKRTVPTTGHGALVVRGQTTRSEDFADQDPPIRVFNRDYVDENVFPSSGGDVAPIFVLGADSAKNQKELDSLNQQKEGIAKQIDKARSRRDRAETDLDNFCKEQAKAIKETLQIQGGAYGNFNKSNYRQRMAEIVKTGNANALRLSREERTRLLRQHHSTNKAKLRPAKSLELPSIRARTETVMRLAQQTVVSSSIPALRDNPHLSDWVWQGLILHKAGSTTNCLMCEQTFPERRLEELEGHFNVAYERLLDQIGLAKSEVLKVRDELRHLSWPDSTAVYDDLAEDYSEASSKLGALRNKLCEHLESLAGVLEQKRAAPFSKLYVEVPIPLEEADESARLNQVIDLHNSRTDEYEAVTNQARKRIADGSIANRLDDFLAKDKEAKEASAAFESNKAKLDRIEGRMLELETEMLEHRRPADELNDDLRQYLGHRELTIRVKDTGYAIMRSGSVAASLSDGERTALALLYFLKTLGDHRFNAGRGVVVLDDPVSSLDANAMYLALGFIKDRTQAAGQLFILTHNFSFFRQVRNWFHHLPRQNSSDIARRPARFYMLGEVASAEPRRTTIARPAIPAKSTSPVNPRVSGASRKSRSRTFPPKTV